MKESFAVAGEAEGAADCGEISDFIKCAFESGEFKDDHRCLNFAGKINPVETFYHVNDWLRIVH